MKLQVRLAVISFALAAALVAAIIPVPVSAAEYTLKWAVVTRGDMQEKFGHKLADVAEAFIDSHRLLVPALPQSVAPP